MHDIRAIREDATTIKARLEDRGAGTGEAIDEILAEMESGRGMIGREVQIEALLCRIGKAMRTAA